MLMTLWLWLREKILSAFRKKAPSPIPLPRALPKMPVVGQLYKHRTAQKMAFDYKNWDMTLTGLSTTKWVENPWSRPLLFTKIEQVPEYPRAVVVYFMAGEEEQTFNFFIDRGGDPATEFSNEFFHWFEDYEQVQ
jgi:hypothetical protein